MADIISGLASMQGKYQTHLLNINIINLGDMHKDDQVFFKIYKVFSSILWNDTMTSKQLKDIKIAKILISFRDEIKIHKWLVNEWRACDFYYKYFD